jgi:subtilisin family serine protease
MGNPVEYPAALLQPVGSNGNGGTGLVVGASDAGGRASFSGSGSWISLAAPGVDVYGALGRGRYGHGSGTSFAAAEVSGAAALVWAANPLLTARQVARILEETASGQGTWTPDLGYGVVDAAAAVARAKTG